MITEQLIQRVISGYNKGVQSDDSRLTPRHVYNKLLTSRKRLITQQARKHQKISDWNYMVLPCIELIEVPSHECPCLPEVGCSVFRTKHPLPKPLTDLNNNLVEWFMSVDSGILIDQSTREKYSYIKGNKYTKDKLTYILEGGHAFFYGKRVPKVVKTKLLPEDPQDVYNYPSICPDCEDCEDCTSILDQHFPIDGDLEETLIEMAIQELVEMFSKMQEDQTNNTADSAREQSK